MHQYARESILFTVACALWACSVGGREQASVKAAEQRAVSVLDLPTQGVASSAAPVASASSDGAPEWDKVKLEDEAPLCVFADHVERGSALFLQEVREQTLRADSRVVFGAFSPGCLNEACDAPPTLQCWVNSEEPNTLVVHSRLSFEHRRGTVCTKDCHPVVAGCETEVLKAGTYTVKYGRRTFSIRVPGVLRAPCFKLE